MLIEAEIWTVAKTDQGNAVLVKPLVGDRAVPIFIGPLEAQNILLGLGEVDIPRPLTHDLMLHLLGELNAKLLRVVIHTLSEGTYYANLVLEHSGKMTEVDARPSDALALAVRAACPIFIESELVAESGIAMDQLRQASVETPEESDETEESEEEQVIQADLAARKEAQLETLRTRLERLVAQENYEQAAQVRDQIRELEDSGFA
jgi:bifunctional DNase/RNase